MPFKKGQSGNPRGRAKDKPFLDALRIAIADAGDNHKVLRNVATKVLKRAEAGDMTAITFLADRLDGKAAQAITNGEDGPFEVAVTRIERVIIDDKPDPLLSGLSEEDALIVREIVAMVKETVPSAGEQPPAGVFGVIRDALRRQFGGR